MTGLVSCNYDAIIINYEQYKYRRGHININEALGFFTRKAKTAMALSETVKIEPKTDMISDPSGEAGDLSYDGRTEELGPGDGGTGKKRKVFPYHITSELKGLYKSGMIGVGIQYSSLIDTACERTGLSRAQVKVSFLALLLIYLPKQLIEVFSH